MGRPILPSISKLEDVLNLLTDPEKYTKYLSEFKQVYDETMNILGVLDTKQKADAYLADASDKLHAAELHAKNSHAVHMAKLLEVTETMRGVSEAEKIFEAKVVADASEYERKQAELMKKYAECQSYVDKQSRSLQDKQDYLDALTSKLEVEADLSSALREKYEAVARAIGLKVE